jgi:hypothetical protein
MSIINRWCIMLIALVIATSGGLTFEDVLWQALYLLMTVVEQVLT